MKLRHSELESRRFGLRVFRGSGDSIDADAFARALDDERVDVAIVRIPASRLASLDALRRRGLDPIVADTLVRYDLPLDAVPASRGDDAVTLRRATSDDAKAFERTARAVFAGYTSHYHANPLFAADAIVDGYAEWAANHLGDDAAIAWWIERDDEIAGFSCARFDAATSTAVGTLNGVLPAARGRGVYRGMLQRMLEHFAAEGFARFAIATQVQNVVVQRAWTASGFTLRAAENTIHVNAMRNAGR